MWDDFWEGFWNAVGEVIGTVTARAFFSEKGREVLAKIAVFGGIGLFIVLIFASCDYETIGKIQNLCKSHWQYYYTDGKMYNQYHSLLQSDTKYEYSRLAYSKYSNIALLYARPKQVGMRSYMALVFAPYKQKYYSCLLCISKSNNASWQYPTDKPEGLSCPTDYYYYYNITSQ